MNFKKLIYILIMCTTLIACDKMPANGDLDGMWQLVEITHDGTIRNVQQDQIYMSIQLKLFMLGRKENSREYYGYFEHKDGYIHFWQFSYASTNESESDNNFPIQEANKSLIERWGYYSLDEKFKVIQLTSNKLILENDNARIKYIKF